MRRRRPGFSDSEIESFRDCAIQWKGRRKSSITESLFSFPPIARHTTFIRTIVLEFESVDAARKWYNSREYQAIIGERHACSEGNAAIVAGLEMPVA
jgi:antibiotic biosynthesis monooxygenase (ABM) superfamily enzyme